jgi:hypothetical protein
MTMNWLAVLVAAIIYLVLGLIWFQKPLCVTGAILAVWR